MRLCGILVLPPGIKLMPLGMEVQCLNHWTTREVPKLCSYPKYAVTVGNSLNVSGPHFAQFQQDSWIRSGLLHVPTHGEA